MESLYLIDASPYIFRAFYSIPPKMFAPDGMPTNAVYGYTEFLLQVLKQRRPAHIAVAFDGSLTTSFRNEIYPAYKAQRALPPPELEAQLQACFEVTVALGIPAFIDDRLEADDLIGTLLADLAQDGIAAVIVSSDKDFAQLVNDNVTLWDFARDRTYDVGAVREKFGVRPEQIVDWLALVGDSVDNIPGVQGVGPKIASALLGSFESIEEMYGSIDDILDMPVRGAKGLWQKLRAQRQQAMLSKRLATIEKGAKIETNLAGLKYQGPVAELVSQVSVKYGFGNLSDRIESLQNEI